MDDIKSVQNTLESLKKVAANGEHSLAHAMEDYLYKFVMSKVAAGNPNSKVLAQLALTSQDIVFDRNYE